MARHVTKLLCRLAVGSSVSFGCLATIAGEPPHAAAEAHIKLKDELAGQASAADTDAPPAPGVADESVGQKKELATEVITERYTSRAVRIERHVAQDEDGNYFNHGPWSHWDESGVLKGSGEYRNGLRQGKWVRWFNAGEGKILASALYKNFQAPFVSEATFTDGKLQGTWSIYDTQGRLASEWQFEQGELHGQCVWYFPSGHKQREAEYQHGQMEGQLLEWTLEPEASAKAKNGKLLPGKHELVHTLVTKSTYQNGRRQSAHIEYHSPGVKKAEGTYLFAKEITKTSHDFWNGEVYTMTIGKEGVNQRHGHWVWWYKDGGKQMEGDYDRDQPVGLHVWWYSNGQKQTEGEFENGKEIGRWTWWHANGQKMTEGQFTEGKQTGRWSRWNAQGKVEESLDIDKVQLAEEAQAAPAETQPAVPEQNRSTMRQPRPSRIESARKLPLPTNQPRR